MPATPRPVVRWTIEQVASVAPTPRSLAGAEAVAEASTWMAVGVDDRVLWGRFQGSGSEPYDTMVDHVEVGWRCSCPSRRAPCKHALGLLMLWVRGGVPEATAPTAVAKWRAGRDRRATVESAGESEMAVGDPPPARSDGDTDRNIATDDAGRDSPAPDGTDRDGTDRDGPDRDGTDRDGPDRDGPDRDGLDRARDERVARMMEGLVELDRWLEDRMRTGLADPALANYATWDGLAARLVDARAGALANRVRRLAGLVGDGVDWHSEVLSELGMLHLISQAGRRIPDLPGPLADAVATASGWQVRQTDVLGGVPETDDWLVAGRSDVREDRIEVRRIWLRGQSTRRWAMLLSFAAYQQSLDDSFAVGSVVRGDLHRYPGGSLRALAGRRDPDPLPIDPSAQSMAVDIATACDEIGVAVANEPWIDRYPAMVVASPTMTDGRWVLTDATGSLALLGSTRAVGSVVAASMGAPLVLTIEWTPRGVVPLVLHLSDRTIDVGPRADRSFVREAI